MVTVKKGQVIQITKAGNTNGQNWACGEVMSDSEKDFRRVTVFAEPADVEINLLYEIADISQVTISKRKYQDKMGQPHWVDSYAIKAKLVPCSPDAKIAGFSEIDEDIPF